MMKIISCCQLDIDSVKQTCEACFKTIKHKEGRLGTPERKIVLFLRRPGQMGPRATVWLQKCYFHLSWAENGRFNSLESKLSFSKMQKLVYETLQLLLPFPILRWWEMEEDITVRRQLGPSCLFFFAWRFEVGTCARWERLPLKFRQYTYIWF